MAVLKCTGKTMDGNWCVDDELRATRNMLKYAPLWKIWYKFERKKESDSEWLNVSSTVKNEESQLSEVTEFLKNEKKYWVREMENIELRINASYRVQERKGTKKINLKETQNAFSRMQNPGKKNQM